METNHKERDEEIKKLILELIQEKLTLVKTLEARLTAINECMMKLHDPEEESKRSALTTSTMENLQLKQEMLELNLKKLKVKQQEDSCPPDLMDDLKKTFIEIHNENIKLESELKHWEEVEARYEALGPQFKEYLQEWMDLEEKISVKEWALKELENIQNCSGLDDSILSDTSFST